MFIKNWTNYPKQINFNMFFAILEKFLKFFDFAIDFSFCLCYNFFAYNFLLFF